MTNRFGSWIIAACLVLLCSGCGGGGGGGAPTPTTPTPTPTPTAGITFTEDGQAPSNSLFLRAQTSASTSSLVLEVVATDVADLYGVAFDLIFPATALSFQGATEGVFLSGAQTSLQATANGAVLIVGYSKLGAVSGSSGGGVLMTLRFDSVNSGGGPITFDNQRAINSSGQDLPGLSWVSGEVTITS